MGPLIYAYLSVSLSNHVSESICLAVFSLGLCLSTFLSISVCQSISPQKHKTHAQKRNAHVDTATNTIPLSSSHTHTHTHTHTHIHTHTHTHTHITLWFALAQIQLSLPADHGNEAEPLATLVLTAVSLVGAHTAHSRLYTAYYKQ